MNFDINRFFEFFFGYLSFDNPIIIPIFFTWQFYQLYQNKKIFLLENRVEIGNSPDHTAKKIAFFVFGYWLARF